MIKEIIEEAMSQEIEICNQNFKDCKEKLHAERLEIKDSNFQKCVCTESILERTCFYNVVFENCDFSNTNFQNSDFMKVKFINCKLVGCKFIDAIFSEVTMNNNNLQYSDLYHTEWKHVNSKKNNYTSASIQECHFKHVIFDLDCFRQAQLFKTKLKEIDFSSCDISGIVVDIGDIRGRKCK